MNEITTDETRTCRECSEPYQHVACYWDDEKEEYDYNAEVYTCPTCLPTVLEREERERQAREEEDRRQAKEKAAKALWERIVPKVYRETDTSHPDYPKPIHSKAMEWIKAIESPDGNASLWFGLIGNTGRCKTRVISQLIRRMIWAGRKCEWVNAAEFQRLVQGQWDDAAAGYSLLGREPGTVGGRAKKRLAAFRKCDVLVFDDLGKGRLTETVAGALYDLIEERTAQGRVMLWTSNASLDDLLQMLPKDCGGPIVRRLIDFSTIIKL